MNRRKFTKVSLSSIAAVSAFGSANAASQQQYYELRTYELRRDMNPERINQFFADHMVPSLKKRASGPIGCFSVSTGSLTPALNVLTPYNSLSQLRANTELASGGDSFIRAWKSFEKSSELPYVRYQSSLLKAFAGHPQIEVPPSGEDHLFELRIYESRDTFDAVAKVEMFNEEEIQIFRDCGMRIVFFGESMFGTRLPNLVYMLAWKDMAERQQIWRDFGANEDWNRIKVIPKWANAVSNIHASFLSATDFSEIS
jgi:hypothetical protein